MSDLQIGRAEARRPEGGRFEKITQELRALAGALDSRGDKQYSAKVREFGDTFAALHSEWEKSERS